MRDKMPSRLAFNDGKFRCLSALQGLAKISDTNYVVSEARYNYWSHFRVRGELRSSKFGIRKLKNIALS